MLEFGITMFVRQVDSFDCSEDCLSVDRILCPAGADAEGIADSMK